jgi:hypothetical protein
VEYTHPSTKKDPALDDRLLVLTRDGLNRRSFVTSCLDLIDPRHPHYITDDKVGEEEGGEEKNHHGLSKHKKRSQSEGGHDATQGMNLVNRVSDIVRGPIGLPPPPVPVFKEDKASAATLPSHPSFNHKPKLNRTATALFDKVDNSVHGEDTSGGGGSSFSLHKSRDDDSIYDRRITDLASSSVAIVADEEELELELAKSTVKTLPFKKDPLLQMIYQNRHLVPKSGLLDPTQSISETQAELLTRFSKHDEYLEEKSASLSEVERACLYPVASDEEEAQLRCMLLPIPPKQQQQALKDLGEGENKSHEEHDSDKMSRRRGLTLTSTSVRSARTDSLLPHEPGSNSSGSGSGDNYKDHRFFKPTVPPTRTILGPEYISQCDGHEDDHDESLNGMGDARFSAGANRPSSSQSFNESNHEDLPRGRLEKSRLFLNNFLETAAPDLNRVEILSQSEELEHKIETLDLIPERENHVIWVLFARNSKANDNDNEDGSRDSVGGAKVAGKVPSFAETPLPPIEIVGMKGQCCCCCCFCLAVVCFHLLMIVAYKKKQHEYL